MINIRYKKTGFSLIEICIACCVLGVLMVPIFTMMSKGTAGTVHNKNEILARQYAANLLAYCNLLNYNDDFLKAKSNEKFKIREKSLPLKLSDGSNIDLSETNKVFDIVDSFESFKNIDSEATITIVEFPKDDNWSGYKTVSVKVEWKDASKPKKDNVEITGLISEQ